jgi:hypothetical protein
MSTISQQFIWNNFFHKSREIKSTNIQNIYVFYRTAIVITLSPRIKASPI